MKKYSRYFFVLAPVALLLLLASPGSAQRLGGYKSIDAADAGAAAAADFAVTAQAEKLEIEIELVSIEKAESQVVAGTNYRLCLTVATSEGEYTAKVVVHRDLKGNHKLTSWDEDECAE